MYVAVHLKIDQNEGFVYKRSKLKDKGEYYTLKHASGDFHLFFFYQWRSNVYIVTYDLNILGGIRKYFWIIVKGKYLIWLVDIMTKQMKTIRCMRRQDIFDEG